MGEKCLIQNIPIFTVHILFLGQLNEEG